MLDGDGSPMLHCKRSMTGSEGTTLTHTPASWAAVTMRTSKVGTVTAPTGCTSVAVCAMLRGVQAKTTDERSSTAMIKTTYTAQQIVPLHPIMDQHNLTHEVTDFLVKQMDREVPAGYTDNSTSYIDPLPTVEYTYEMSHDAIEAETVMEMVIAEFLPGEDSEHHDYMSRSVASSPVIYGYFIDLYLESLEEDSAVFDGDNEDEILRLTNLKESIIAVLHDKQWTEKCVLLHENHAIDFHNESELSEMGEVWYDSELYYVMRMD